MAGELSTGQRRGTASLPGGPLEYLIRPSFRARWTRLTIHPEDGLVVTQPVGRRGGPASGDAAVLELLVRREAWIRRHLERCDASRAALAARPPLDGGRVIPYRGLPHRVRVVDEGGRARRSRVTRDGGEVDEIVVRRGGADDRSTAAILEGWCRSRARDDLHRAIDRHSPIVGVSPSRVAIRDTRTRWGSCSRRRTLSFSWRLVLAPPEALESVVVHELCHLRVFGHGPRFRGLLDAYAPRHATARRWLRGHASELHAALD